MCKLIETEKCLSKRNWKGQRRGSDRCKRREVVIIWERGKILFRYIIHNYQTKELENNVWPLLVLNLKTRDILLPFTQRFISCRSQNNMCVLYILFFFLNGYGVYK